MTGELVRLQAVTRRFEPDVTAVDQVDLTVHPGEIIAIKGVSGSGKSTLLNILGLLDRPTDGSYQFNGAATTRLSERELTELRRHQIGFVFQAFHLVDHLTVLENVTLGLAYAQVSTNRRHDLAADALQAVGLSHRLDARPSTLSGGERQRVAIARAVARQPRLLLCDEPTGNLDSANTRALLQLLEDTHDDDRALLVVTHDPRVADTVPRVLHMQDGTLTGPGIE